jgi:hypothetical protein
MSEHGGTDEQGGSERPSTVERRQVSNVLLPSTSELQGQQTLPWPRGGRKNQNIWLHSHGFVNMDRKIGSQEIKKVFFCK